MFLRIIISLVMTAIIFSTHTEGMLSAALALFAFSLLVYYATHKKAQQRPR